MTEAKDYEAEAAAIRDWADGIYDDIQEAIAHYDSEQSFPFDFEEERVTILIEKCALDFLRALEPRPDPDDGYLNQRLKELIHGAIDKLIQEHRQNREALDLWTPDAEELKAMAEEPE